MYPKVNDELNPDPPGIGLHPQTFARDGYVVLRGCVAPALVEAVRADIAHALSPLLGPVEYEADVGYPGAPGDRDSRGGATPRRLLHACARSAHLRQLAAHPPVAHALGEILAAPVYVSQSHHNCVMTKHPGFSSATLWHQDIRYWSFDCPELVSAWFALGEESRQNGALRVIPGSHLLDLDRGRFDRDLFLRPELSENRSLIRSAVTVELERGDVLLFHCRLFHAAGKNRSSLTKLSPVFTYHSGDNQPIPGTRSAALPGLVLDELMRDAAHDA